MLVLEPKQRGSMKEAPDGWPGWRMEISPSWIARDISFWGRRGDGKLGMVNDGHTGIVIDVLFFLTKRVGMIAQS